MSRIYVASSWRNLHQPAVVEALRQDGHEVYDFRNPPGGVGFGWRQAGVSGEPCGVAELRAALDHPVARAGFLSDIGAMAWADTCVLVLPCGRSAHLELGWFAGQRRRTVVYLPDGSPQEPDLMYSMCDALVGDLAGVLASVRR